MVQTPLPVHSHGSWRQQLCNPFGQFRLAWRRIFNLIELGWKPPKVMDGSRRRHGGDKSAGDIPVGRYREHGRGFGYGRSAGSPGAGEFIVGQGVHRIAMAKKDGGHIFHWRALSRLTHRRLHLMCMVVHIGGIRLPDKIDSIILAIKSMYVCS